MATFEVPRELWLALGDRVLDMLKGSDSGVDVKAARKDLHRNKKKVRVKVIYNPEKHWIRLRFLRGKKGYQLYGKVNLTSEAMEFINISADEDTVMAGRLMADEYFDGDAVQALLQEAISRLPDVQRTVFTLRYYDEMKYSEMSQLLKTSEGSLKASYHIAVKKISEFFKSHD